LKPPQRGLHSDVLMNTVPLVPGIHQTRPGTVA
jgi:hypothetical protein